MGEIVYTVTLTREEYGFEAKLNVNGDPYAAVTSGDRVTCLAYACDYIMSTEGLPTDSVGDPLGV